MGKRNFERKGKNFALKPLQFQAFGQLKMREEPIKCNFQKKQRSAGKKGQIYNQMTISQISVEQIYRGLTVSMVSCSLEDTLPENVSHL